MKNSDTITKRIRGLYRRIRRRMGIKSMTYLKTDGVEKRSNHRALIHGRKKLRS